MVDRIKSIMEYKQMSPTAFADAIEINRSSLTHIFSGRNQPSLDVAKKILKAFPEISTEWLIMGMGNMLQPISTPPAKEEARISVTTVDNMQQTDLFSAFDMEETEEKTETKEVVENEEIAEPVVEVIPVEEPKPEPIVEEDEPAEEPIPEPVAVSEPVAPPVEKVQPVVTSQPTPRTRVRNAESHISNRESKREKISNSQGDKKIAKIIFFYEDKSFDVYMPN